MAVRETARLSVPKRETIGESFKGVTIAPRQDGDTRTRGGKDWEE
jgi:hypothetical protein